MYGLTKENRVEVLNKIEKQKDFLSSHYIVMDGSKVKLSSFFKNTFINSDRYVAELQHRVWSLVEFAKDRNLVNIFLTLTLPSEYHRKKTLRSGKIIRNDKFANSHLKLYDITTKEKATFYNRLVIKFYKTKNLTKWTGKVEKVSLDVKDYMPIPASKELTRMWEKIRKDRAWQSLSKEDRVYFRVTEPHKDGTPHLHISIWIPKSSVSKIISSIQRLYPAPLSDISTSYIPENYDLYGEVYKKSPGDKSCIRVKIDDAISYLMKYIYKTLDDLRDKKGITDITMWYIYHGICRFYTSRTLISLNIYRPLSSKYGYSLLDLTYSYCSDTISVLIDPESREPKLIQYEDIIIWNKKRFELKSFSNNEDDFDCDDEVDNIIELEIDGVEYYLYNNSIIPTEVDISFLERIPKEFIKSEIFEPLSSDMLYEFGFFGEYKPLIVLEENNELIDILSKGIEYD